MPLGSAVSEWRAILGGGSEKAGGMKPVGLFHTLLFLVAQDVAKWVR